MTKKEMRERIIDDIITNKYHTILENAIYSLKVNVELLDNNQRILETMDIIERYSKMILQPFKMEDLDELK